MQVAPRHLQEVETASMPHHPSRSRGDDHDVKAIEQQGNSALINAKRNFNFLISPTTSKDKPKRLRTRALLRTFRYVGQFILWRLVRWAKYAAVGALVAAIGATAFGSVVTGAAWVVAPPTIGASILASVIWGIGKYTARKMHRRWDATGRDVGELQRELKEDDPVEVEAMPW